MNLYQDPDINCYKIIDNSNKTFLLDDMFIAFKISDAICDSSQNVNISYSSLYYNDFVYNKSFLSIEPCELGKTFYIKFQNLVKTWKK